MYSACLIEFAHCAHTNSTKIYTLIKIQQTLACACANPNLVEVVTVADVDDEHRVGNSLLQI